MRGEISLGLSLTTNPFGAGHRAGVRAFGVPRLQIHVRRDHYPGRRHGPAALTHDAPAYRRGVVPPDTRRRAFPRTLFGFPRRLFTCRKYRSGRINPACVLIQILLKNCRFLFLRKPYIGIRYRSMTAQKNQYDGFVLIGYVLYLTSVGHL